MPLINMKDMLMHAYKHHYAIGAFDLINLDFLEGILTAAERCEAPVILSLAESHFAYFDFDILMKSVLEAANRTRVPVAIHLDHGESLSSAVRGIKHGCNGVMIDASTQPLRDNIKDTRRSSGNGTLIRRSGCLLTRQQRDTRLSPLSKPLQQRIIRFQKMQPD